MSAPVRFPRFYVTAPAPCPYLPGRQERKVFTELAGPDADALNDALGRIGFRRSQTVAYRPSCAGCNACVSVRVVADEFVPSRTQARTMAKNSDVIATACRPWSTVEQYDLLQKYLKARHPGGGMSTMDSMDYADMIEQSPVTSYVVEYRERDDDGQPGRLIGACLTDRQNDGLSMIYSFYDPHHPARSGLGNFIILDHIDRAAKAGLPYVYLGYWIEGSSRMNYKIRYRPLERLGREGWERLDAGKQDALIAATVAQPRPDKEDARVGGNKDGMPGGQDQYRILED